MLFLSYTSIFISWCNLLHGIVPNLFFSCLHSSHEFRIEILVLHIFENALAESADILTFPLKAKLELAQGLMPFLFLDLIPLKRLMFNALIN